MNTVPAQPYRSFRTGDGFDVPLYLMEFDKEGRCTSPEHRRRILEEAGSGRFTDIHIYSHGWNNVFNEAIDHYAEFFHEYFQLRSDARLSDGGYRPLLVGVIWPSTALLSEAERGPDLAGPVDAGTTDLADELPAASRERFLALARNPAPLDHGAALELASLLCPILERESTDAEGYDAPVTPESLVESWEGAAGVGRGPDDGRQQRGPAGTDEGAAAPRTAGRLGFLNPKEIIRKATVYLMKDRAGTVGAHGVASLLGELLAKSSARVHLTGHSYGGKVVLSALAHAELPRKVTSVLLLQPAVNTYCFASRIPGNEGREGGYRNVLGRTRLPVLSTFSSRDRALHDFFAIALRRGADLGEPRTAGGSNSRFAALGGVGPSGVDEREVRHVSMLNEPERYEFGAARILALDGSDGAIKDHGDVRNPYTEWALANLVEAGRARQ